GYALAIPAAQLILHLLVVPVPLAFLPFSLSGNFFGTLLACAYVAHHQPRLRLRISDGFLLLRGGVLLCLVSALTGTLASDFARRATAEGLTCVYLQWALGDLLRVTATTPCLLLLFARNLHIAAPLPVVASLRERVAWIAAMLLALAGGIAIVHGGSLYPLSVATLPLALLLWSAARFPPLFTAAAAMAVTVTLGLTVGIGLGGFN